MMTVVRSTPRSCLISPLAEVEALRLIAPAFTVEELADRRGAIQFRRVDPQQIFPIVTDHVVSTARVFQVFLISYSFPN